MAVIFVFSNVFCGEVLISGVMVNLFLMLKNRVLGDLKFMFRFRLEVVSFLWFIRLLGMVY